MSAEPAITLKRSAIRPARLVEVAFAPFTGQFSQKDITVEMNLPYTLPAVSCDIAKTAWVLTIFFSNAIRYTPQWGKLAVRAALENGLLRLSVENSGYGVPLERLQQMFERNENPDSPDFSQSLALVLAREIVEAQGGTIGAVSELGVMTRFYITLPIDPSGEKL